MGLDTFPLLKDQKVLITYNNNVFKFKLDYQEMSQEKKAVFVKNVSEQAAHCQIEDVCRAVLYSIERDEKLSPIQTDNFIIYPEIQKWHLAKEIIFIVDGRSLSCHKDQIQFKLVCKDITDIEKNQSSHSRSTPKNDTKRQSPTLMKEMEAQSPTNKKSRELQLDTPKGPYSQSPKNKRSNLGSLQEASKIISQNSHQKINSTISSVPKNTGDCNKNLLAPCADKESKVDTPQRGINNKRGRQSPKSVNKITTVIERHGSTTDLPETDNQIMPVRLTKSNSAKIKKSTKILSNLTLPNSNEEEKLVNQKRKKDLEESLNDEGGKSLNVTSLTNVKKSCSCELSQCDYTQGLIIGISHTVDMVLRINFRE